MDDNDVGYKKPPRHSRFKPGQSGNPNGRPKGAKGVATIVQKVIAEKVTLNQNGKATKVSKLEAGIQLLAKEALSGDIKALIQLLALARQYGPASPEAPTARTEISDQDRDVFKILPDLLQGLEK